MSAFAQIRYDVAEGIATITLNRPEKMNATTATMISEMMTAFDLSDADDSVRAVIVTGAGERAFCAGGDLTQGNGGWKADKGGPVDSLSDPRVREGGGVLSLRIFQSTKPVIGAINGVAVGVGVSMMLPMDIRLASTSARFGLVYARRGIAPEGIASWFLPRVVGLPTALEWCMTGRIFPAQEALEHGLIRSLHAPGDLLGAARAIGREIADNTSATAVAMTRAMLWRLPWEDHPMAAHRIDSRAFYRLSKAADASEGIASFLEKRSPAYPDKVSRDMPDFYPWWDEPDYS